MRRAAERSRRGVVPAVFAGLLAALGAGTAQAAEYRYWSFWDSKDGQWSYATQGPSTTRPADGSVAGFRFALSEDSAAAGKPRGAADFDAICAGTPAKDGTKRVAIVVDFGTKAAAPGGETPPGTRTECARITEDASAGDALAAVAKPLRYDSNALLCAISGYPKAGCGEQVSGSGDASADAGKKSAEPSANGGEDGDDGPSAGLIAGIAAVVVLGAAAIWQAGRRRG
jgi:hypothetical protein